MTSQKAVPLRTRKPRHANVMLLRNRTVAKISVREQIATAQPPRTRISKVRATVLHLGACQLKSLNDCSSNALHELSCGHLFCSECIVAHLRASKKKRDYCSTRRKSLSGANLNMKQRKLACFLCRKFGQCGCCKRETTSSEGGSSRTSHKCGAGEGCYIRPPGGMCVHMRQRSNCKECSKNLCPHNKALKGGTFANFVGAARTANMANTRASADFASSLRKGAVPYASMIASVLIARVVVEALCAFT
jgi:hypothetical protein